MVLVDKLSPLPDDEDIERAVLDTVRSLGDETDVIGVSYEEVITAFGSQKVSVSQEDFIAAMERLIDQGQCYTTVDAWHVLALPPI